MSDMGREPHDVEREHIRGIYERLGFRSLAPGPHTSKPHPEHVIYPYFLRGATINRIDHVWSTDITYIRLQRGFVYLMAIIDWHSRYVFCIETLGRALEKGKCSIFNTDQGAQFTSKKFTELLISHQMALGYGTCDQVPLLCSDAEGQIIIHVLSSIFRFQR